jgi:serine/threonine protein phosphatase PrpC
MSADTLTIALRSAEEAVRALPMEATSNEEPPETTVVAGVRQGRRFLIGWLGDSRAYLVSSTGARQLTEDHSWVNEVVAAGTMTRAQAQRAPLAHAVTRTLGGRSKCDEPALRCVDLADESAMLVLCSDGLWNYAPEPWQLVELLRRQPSGADALILCRALVQHALDHGGHDNVTAAILMLGAEVR